MSRAKNQIREICAANTYRTDNYPDVVRALRPHLQQLLQRSPRPRGLQAQRAAEQEKARRVLGVWRQLWSNLAIGPVPYDLGQSYQVVGQGFYWNLSQYPGAVGGLRGAYVLTPRGLAVRFTRAVLAPGPTLQGLPAAGLTQLAGQLEQGGGRRVPGPVGITGLLTTLYVDEDLRVAGGEQTPLFDDFGRVLVPGRIGLLFVLDRVA